MGQAMKRGKDSEKIRGRAKPNGSLIKIAEQANAAWPSALSGAGDLVVMRFCPISEEDIDISSPKELYCSMDMGFVAETNMVSEKSSMRVRDEEIDVQSSRSKDSDPNYVPVMSKS